jgi:hypothetical protein
VKQKKIQRWNSKNEKKNERKGDRIGSYKI